VATCAYTISPSSTTLAATASSGNTIAVTGFAMAMGGGSTPCSWTATCPDSWVTITSASGSGAGNVVYSVSANTTNANRTSTITVGGLAFALTQLPGACTYSISPLGANFTSSAFTAQTFAVMTQSACPWVATCPDAWITLTTSSGSGGGNVVYNVAANAGVGRNSTITVNGIAFTVTQQGSSCSYLLQPTSETFNAGGGSDIFQIITQNACAWTAVSNNNWITITSGASGTGPGTVGFSVASNSGSAIARLGSITAGGLTFAISQNAGQGAGFGVLANPELPCLNGTTRPYMRDRIRIAMGVTPPSQTLPDGVVGEAPMGQTTPTNAEINQAITDAISRLNTRVGFNGSTSVTVAVPAASANGVQYFPMQGMGTGSGSQQNNIDSIQKCVWNPGPGQALVPLVATSQAELDRLQYAWDNYPPAVPQFYMVERYQLGIVPPAQSAGTLQLYAGTAVYNFCSDTDVLNELPVDYELVLEQMAVLLLSQRRPQEPGAMSRIQFLGGSDGSGETSGQVHVGIKLLAQFYNDTVVQNTKGVGMVNLRQSYGKRRLRR
jgi:Putative binding domain, N-terminal/Viral BACON domain